MGLPFAERPRRRCCRAAQEVRLYTALCLTHVLRLTAPEAPFTDQQQKVRRFDLLPERGDDAPRTGPDS